jgi:hypothetical protein
MLRQGNSEDAQTQFDTDCCTIYALFAGKFEKSPGFSARMKFGR